MASESTLGKPGRQLAEAAVGWHAQGKNQVKDEDQCQNYYDWRDGTGVQPHGFEAPWRGQKVQYQAIEVESELSVDSDVHQKERSGEACQQPRQAPAEPAYDAPGAFLSGVRVTADCSEEPGRQ